MKVVFAAVLLIGIVIRAFPQNLIVNPGFETWTLSTKPAGWTTTQNCLKDSSFIKSGNYSCRHAGGTETKYLGQTINVTTGKQYSLKLCYKTETTGTGKGCRIWCYWKDSAGNNINDTLSDDIIRPSLFLKNDIWQNFSVDIIAPANASKFYLEVRSYPNSVTYWDDFVFEETVITNSANLIGHDIKLYPNPACIYLIISNIHDVQYIDIQDITGMVVRSYKLPGVSELIIPVADLKNGLYLVRISVNKNQLIRKFIKSN